MTTRERLLAIQRAAGNRAVATAIGGRPSPAVQRQGTLVTAPVVIAADPGQQAELQRRSDAMMARFPEVVRGYCQDWFAAATSALASVPEPANPSEAANFWKALAGNMGWALGGVLTIPGDGLPLATGAALSAAGAGVGSGALATAAPPSGRSTIGLLLATERDQLEQRFGRAFLAGVVTDCLDRPETRDDTDAQDRLLWRKFAPTVVFESRVATMTAKLGTTIANWLQTFQDQWLEWRARPDVIARAREYELADAASGPFGDPIDVLGDLIGVGTPADRFFDLAQRDIPLNVVFTAVSVE